MTILFIFLIGLAIGSFSNVLIDRLAHGESIQGRSHCDYCKKTLEPQDLIPVISYFILRGKCRNCGRKLSIQYPVIELWTGVLFVATWALVVNGMLQGYIQSAYPIVTIVSYLALVSCLNVIFFTDAKYQIIPDGMQIALFISVVLVLFTQGIVPQQLAQRVIAAVIVMAPILALYIVTKGKGMGFADVKISLTIGFLLGTLAGLLALYIGFLVGAAVGIVLLLSGLKKLKSRIAFGPFLIVGMVVMLVWGPSILSTVHRLYGF